MRPARPTKAPVTTMKNSGCAKSEIDFRFESAAVRDVLYRLVTGLCEQHLLRTLQRLHADLTERLDVGGDGGEPVDEALVACVQLGLPLRAVGPSPCEPPPTRTPPSVLSPTSFRLVASVRRLRRPVPCASPSTATHDSRTGFRSSGHSCSSQSFVITTSPRQRSHSPQGFKHPGLILGGAQPSVPSGS